MQYNKQVPSDISTFWLLAVSLKKNLIGQRSVWHFVLLSVFMNGLSLLHTSIPCASRQTNDFQFYADERRPATSLYCFVLLLYRVSMVMCAACVHGKSFISFVSLERGTRGITEPQDTQSQTCLWLGPCSESSGSVKVPRSACTLTASWHIATFSLLESKTGRMKTGR